MIRIAAALALILGVAAPCGAQPARIPGTPIEDTPAHRAILETCDKYRLALVRRDADTVLRVVSDAYRDDAGTPTPDDDVDRAGLEAQLRGLLTQVDSITYDARWISLRRTNDRATVVVEYRGTFVMDGRRVARQDRHAIELVREQGGWLIVSGF